jgi:hypothetical protein
VRSERQTTIWHAEGADCSWGKLNSISDFLQEIAAWRNLRIALFYFWLLSWFKVILKYTNLSVMAGLDPAIHAASAPFASHFRFM